MRGCDSEASWRRGGECPSPFPAPREGILLLGHLSFLLPPSCSRVGRLLPVACLLLLLLTPLCLPSAPYPPLKKQGEKNPAHRSKSGQGKKGWRGGPAPQPSSSRLPAVSPVKGGRRREADERPAASALREEAPKAIKRTRRRRRSTALVGWEFEFKIASLFTLRERDGISADATYHHRRRLRSRKVDMKIEARSSESMSRCNRPHAAEAAAAAMLALDRSPKV